MDKVKKQNLIFMNFDQVLSDRFGRYSKYIIQDRALPDVRDGLKPVQRRIMYAMYDLQLFHNRPFKKSARVVGEVIGKYHPHGDSSIYEAMVRMSQTWKMNIPLIDMHGNNGSIDDDPAAAMRYTEARLSKISESMLNNIRKESVAFAPNFDDSESEPTVLPGIFPNLLVNGARGIASGFATEMPPHNLKEIVEAIITRIKSPNCRLATLLEIVKGPDFPTGGTVIDDGGIFQAFERGSGRIIVRSKYELNTTKGNPSITITEIPFGVVKSKLVKEIDDIAEGNFVYGIKEVRDETDREGLRIYIGLVPGTNVQTILAYLLQKTQMQVYYSYNNVVITNKTPRELNLAELIDDYIKHQQIVIKNYSQYDFKIKQNKLEIVEGLIKVANMIDEVILIIKNAENSKEGVINALVEKLQFTKLQANAIAELRLYRLSRTDQQAYIQEKVKLIEEISFLNKVLNDENELNNYLIFQLKAFTKEFATDRKTEITNESDAKQLEINTEDLVKNEDVYVGVSNFGYLKSLSNKSFEANELENYKLKEDDSLIFLQKVNTLSKLIFITNKGRYVTIPVYKIPGDAKWSSLGQHLNDLTTLYNLEKIISVFEIKNFKKKQWVSIATKEGKIKRLEIEEFNAKRYSTPSICFSLSENDEVIGAKISNNAGQVILITSDGKAVKYPETTINPTGSKSSGIKGITIDDNYVSDLVVAKEEQVIGILSSRGGAKRLKVSSIAPYSRTSKGKAIFATFKNTPHVPICAAIVQPQTYFGFTHKYNEIKYLQFSSIEISNETSGFVGSSLITNGAILKDLNYKESDEKEDLTLEQRFNNVEQKMEKISQMSLDELIKKIK